MPNHIHQKGGDRSTQIGQVNIYNTTSSTEGGQAKQNSTSSFSNDEIYFLVVLVIGGILGSIIGAYYGLEYGFVGFMVGGILGGILGGLVLFLFLVAIGISIWVGIIVGICYLLYLTADYFNRW